MPEKSWGLSMQPLTKFDLQKLNYQEKSFISFDRCAFQSHKLCEEGCLKLLNHDIKKKQFKKGDYIFQAGDRFTNLYNLRKGFVKLEHPLEDGNCQIARFHVPGDYFGLVGAGGGVHRFNTIALTDIELCAIDSLALEELFVTKPEFNQMIQDGMSERMAFMAQHFFYLSTYSAERRLAKFLLDFQNRLQSVNLDKPWIDLPMCREDLRNYLGMTAECLSRTFSALESSGYLKVSNRIITEIYFEGLQKIVDAG